MTQSAIYGELWSHIRDHQSRGETRDGARELFHITRVEFDPIKPGDRAKLLSAKQRGLAHVLARRKEREREADAKRLAHNATRDTALDIVAILRPNHAQAKRHGYGSLEANPDRRPVIHVEQPQPGDAERKARMKHDNVIRDHFIALGAMRTRTWQGWSAKASMQVLELFGSFDEYHRLVAAAKEG